MRLFNRLNRTGFTLIELMIVMSIIGILASIAAPNYQWGYIKAKEAVLRENLYTLRSTIDQFYADQGRYPESLDELTKPKEYLKVIPTDPFTKNNDWATTGPLTSTDGQASGGVYNVHSKSNLSRPPEPPYSEW